jgi:DNA-binding MarR family transcriptional regulator
MDSRLATAESMPTVALSDYRVLAAFRFEIRKFLAFSEKAAREAGIEPQQHQLMLAVKGLPAEQRPTIRALADRLCVEHHTTVALVDKLEARGFATRERGRDDRRQVFVHLTAPGLALLRRLSALHRAQLMSVGPDMVLALHAILESRVPARRQPVAKSKKASAVRRKRSPK